MTQPKPHHTTARELIDLLERQLASAGVKDLLVSFAEVVVVHCWNNEDAFVKGVYVTREAAHHALTADGYTKSDVPEGDWWWHPELFYNAEVHEVEVQE